MRGRFLSNLAFLLFANLLVKPIWIFGIDRTVQNRLGAEEYGLYFSLFNFTLLLQMVLDMGINYFNSRAISRDWKRLERFLPNLLALKLALSGAYMIVSFAVAWILGYPEVIWKLLAFMLLNQIFLSFILYFRSNIAARQQFRADAWFSVLDRLLVIGICAYLLWGPVGPFVLEWFIYAQTAALAVTAVVALIFLGRQLPSIRLQWDRRFIRMILRRTYPFAILGFLMAMYYRLDGVMIERLLPDTGLTEAGIYAAAYRLLDAAHMIPFLFAAILLPTFARMLKKREAIQPLVRTSVGLLLPLAITATLVCWLYRDEWMLWLYTEADGYWGVVFGNLMLAFVPISTIYVYSTLLTAQNELRALNFIALAALATNFLLNLWLIPTQGAAGAVTATVFTQVAIALVQVLVVSRKQGFDLKLWLRVGTFAVLIIPAGYLMRLLGMDFRLTAALVLAMAAGAAFLLGLWRQSAISEVRDTM